FWLCIRRARCRLATN
ncbi:hypothetical protein D046_0170, partial [Vibrio parahaemolyticus V-223/04]